MVARLKLYRIRIRPERAPEVVRVFELSARHTLHDVHEAIVRAFALGDDLPYAFYMSGEHWDRRSELLGQDAAGGPGKTRRTRLYELGLVPESCFAHVFDLGDELWHELVVESIREADPASDEPQLLESAGDPPPRHLPEEEEAPPPDVTELLPLAQQLILLFPSDAAGSADVPQHESIDPDGLEDTDEAGGTEHSALDLTPEALLPARALVNELAKALDGDLDRFFALEDVTKTNLLGMLADLPLALARAGHVDEGAELANVLAFLDPAHFLGERALLLGSAGRHDEALAQLAQNLETSSGDGWIEIKSAETYLVLGDAARAEALLRAAMTQTGDDHVRGDAIDHLLELLVSQERHAEVKALLADERARLDGLVVPRIETVQRVVPKVGRNDLCPCGSGKKHKKCCLV
jgi:tetratricopeptide (TPR) repeat protein